jgi:hypothetical protein
VSRRWRGALRTTCTVVPAAAMWAASATTDHVTRAVGDLPLVLAVMPLPPNE